MEETRGEDLLISNLQGWNSSCQNIKSKVPKWKFPAIKFKSSKEAPNIIKYDWRYFITAMKRISPQIIVFFTAVYYEWHCK